MWLPSAVQATCTFKGNPFESLWNWTRSHASYYRAMYKRASSNDWVPVFSGVDGSISCHNGWPGDSPDTHDIPWAWYQHLCLSSSRVQTGWTSTKLAQWHWFAALHKRRDPDLKQPASFRNIHVISFLFSSSNSSNEAPSKASNMWIACTSMHEVSWLMPCHPRWKKQLCHCIITRALYTGMFPNRKLFGSRFRGKIARFWVVFSIFLHLNAHFECSIFGTGEKHETYLLNQNHWSTSASSWTDALSLCT